MTETLTLPVLPLRNAVLFPGVSTPISAGRGGTVRAIEAALRAGGDALVFAVATVPGQMRQQRNRIKLRADEAVQKCILIGFSDRVGRRMDQGTLRCPSVSK